MEIKTIISGQQSEASKKHSQSVQRRGKHSFKDSQKRDHQTFGGRRPCLHSFHVQSICRRSKKWKQLLSQLCYCLQNNIREGNFYFIWSCFFSSLLFVFPFRFFLVVFFSRQFSFSRQTSWKIFIQPKHRYTRCTFLLLLFYFINISSMISFFLSGHFYEEDEKKPEMTRDMDSGTFHGSYYS